jgi:hypothetical protein
MMESTRASIYKSFSQFAYHLSRCRYVPTSDLMTLLPGGELAHTTRQEIALTFPSLNPGTIRRISPRGYAALTDADGSSTGGSVVFIQSGATLRAFKEEMILRLAIHALCWASGDRAMPANLAYKAARPPAGDIPRRVADNIARGAADRKSCAFYAKILLPEVGDHAAELYGIICGATQDIGSETGTEGETENVSICGICRNSMMRGSTTMLECGHVYHGPCIAECIRVCGNRCPECRFHIRIPTRLVD